MDFEAIFSYAMKSYHQQSVSDEKNGSYKTTIKEKIMLLKHNVTKVPFRKFC